MTVYVESNFVIETALEQEQSPPATGILELAESGAIQLVIPAFALSEPFWTVMNRGDERRRLCSTLEVQVKDLGRSRAHTALASASESIRKDLLSIEKDEMSRLKSMVGRVLNVAQQIHLNSAGFADANAYADQYNLSAQDSIIYSAVMGDLRGRKRSEEKCFLSRDSRAFRHPGIIAELESFNCKYLTTFDSGLDYVRSRIQS